MVDSAVMMQVAIDVLRPGQSIALINDVGEHRGQRSAHCELKMVDIGESIGDEQPRPDFGIQWRRKKHFRYALCTGKGLRYQGDRSFHFGKKRQVRRLMLTGDVNGARQLTLLQTTAKIGNFVREAQEPVAICRTEGGGLRGADNAKAGSKIDQTTHQDRCQVHLRDEVRRVIGAK